MSFSQEKWVAQAFNSGIFPMRTVNVATNDYDDNELYSKGTRTLISSL